MHEGEQVKKPTEVRMHKSRSVAVAILLAAAIITIIFAGSFYMVIHNNVNGLADRYRTNLAGIPLLRNVLPALKETDSLDKLTRDELINKYNDIKKQNEELASKLEESDTEKNKLLDMKAGYEKMKSEIDGLKSDLQSQQTALDQKKNDVDEYKKQVDAIVAKGDTGAFSQYYEKINPDVAKQIYTEIVKKQQADASVKKFAQVYETMDAASAAQIFEKMGSTKINMIAETMLAMKKESSSAILAAMTPAFAAKMTEKLNALYKGQ